MTAQERADCLRWPDARVCGWDGCPWPGYCCDCHSVAYAAMWDARVRLLAILTMTPLDSAKRLAMEAVP